MRPYGLCRRLSEFCDVADVSERGGPTRLHRIKSKNKQTSRRHWARKARRRGQAEIEEQSE